MRDRGYIEQPHSASRRLRRGFSRLGIVAGVLFGLAVFAFGELLASRDYKRVGRELRLITFARVRSRFSPLRRGSALNAHLPETREQGPAAHGPCSFCWQLVAEI